MTAKSFRAALARRGFRQILLWIEIGPIPGHASSHSVGTVRNRDGSINRRASLAHAIKRYEEELAK